MTNSIVNDSNIQIQTNEPNIQMAKDFLLAIHSGCKSDDVIGLMPDYSPSEVPPFGCVNAYVPYSDLKKNFEGYAKKLCESNFKQVTTTANPLKREINRSWKALANHTEKQVTRWTNFVLDFDRADNTKEYPATKEELAEIYQAREEVFDFLQGIGFCSPIKAYSGNGYYLIYSLGLELKEREKSAIEAIYSTISEVINKHTNVKIDKAFFNNLRQNLPIAGTVNRKFPDEPRLRELEDCPPLEEFPAIRQTNSEAMRNFLNMVTAIKKLKESKDTKENSIYIKGEIKDSNFARRDEAIAAWEQNTSWESILEGSGATQLANFAGYTQWRRAGKETGGLSFVTGSNKGGNDRFYCYSTNTIFPSGTAIRKYWVFLMLNGWASNDFKIVNKSAKEAWINNEVMRGINYPYNDESEVTNIESVESEEPEDDEYIPEETRKDGKSKGSLDNFELPGILKPLAEYQNNLAAYECMTLAKGTAPAVFSSWIGKTARLYDNLPLNVNGVILAPISTGKESVNDLIDATDKLMVEYYNENPLTQMDFQNLSLTGCVVGSAQGLLGLLKESSRIFSVHEEAEDLILMNPKEKPNQILTDIRNLIRTSFKLSTKSVGPTKGNPSGKITEYCYNLVVVTQPTSFFKRLNIIGNDNAYKGNLGRYYYVMLNHAGRFNRDRSPTRYDMPKEIWKTYLDLRLMNQEGYDGAKELCNFRPSSFRKLQASETLKNDMDDYCEYMRDEGSKLINSGNETLGSMVTRNAEYAKKFMGIFTLAEDIHATDLTRTAWELGKQFALTSIDVLKEGMSKNNKSIEQEKYEILVNKIKAHSKDGITRRKIYQDIGHIWTYKELEIALGALCEDNVIEVKRVGKTYLYNSRRK